MLTISFFIFIVIIFISRIKLKNDINCLEYDEWLKNKGYKKVVIIFYDNNDDIDDEKKLDNTIVVQNSMKCYIHTGIYNFVVKKKYFSDISVYPEKPDYKDVKGTKEIVINTSLISFISEISD